MIDNSLYFKNSIAGLVVIVLIVFGVKTFFVSSSTSDKVDNSTLEERIQPIGQVYLEGDIDVATVIATKPKAVVKKSRSGESVYTASCAGCHSIGVAGAPKTNNKADWVPRLKRGMDDLIKVTISGKSAILPKGTCGACSSDELRAAIERITK